MEKGIVLLANNGIISEFSINSFKKLASSTHEARFLLETQASGASGL